MLKAGTRLAGSVDVLTAQAKSYDTVVAKNAIRVTDATIRLKQSRHIMLKSLLRRDLIRAYNLRSLRSVNCALIKKPEDGLRVRNATNLLPSGLLSHFLMAPSAPESYRILP